MGGPHRTPFVRPNAKFPLGLMDCIFNSFVPRIRKRVVIRSAIQITCAISGPLHYLHPHKRCEFACSMGVRPSMLGFAGMMVRSAEGDRHYCCQFCHLLSQG
jgi:hypothetical protein